jgi:hypothetical protein
MKFRSLKFLLIVGGAACLASGSATTAEAGIIPWIYDAIFGPVGSQQALYGGYAPTYGAGYGVSYGSGSAIPTSYYGPSYFGPAPTLGLSGSSPCSSGACGTQAFYGTASSCCSPCGGSGCATGACGTGTCGTGDCASGNSGAAPYSGATSSPVTPIPRREDAGPTPTYGNGNPNPGTGSTAAPGFGPTRNREPAPAPMNDAYEAPRPASPASTPPAPAGTRPAFPNDSEGADATPGPTLNLDDKITWRSTPSRQRLTLQPSYTSASVIRKPVYPKSEWTTLPAEASIAKK